MLPFEYVNRSVSQHVIDCLGLEVGHQTNLIATHLLDLYDDRVMLVAIAIREHLGFPAVDNLKFCFDHADSHVYAVSDIFGVAGYMHSKIIHVGGFGILHHSVRSIIPRLYSLKLFLAIPVIRMVHFVFCVFHHFFLLCLLLFVALLIFLMYSSRFLFIQHRQIQIVLFRCSLYPNL